MHFVFDITKPLCECRSSIFILLMSENVVNVMRRCVFFKLLYNIAKNIPNFQNPCWGDK